MSDAVKLVPPLEKVRLRKLTTTDGAVHVGMELEYRARRAGAHPPSARPRPRGRGAPRRATGAARREAAVPRTLIAIRSRSLPCTSSAADLPDGHDIVRRPPAMAQARSGGDRRRMRRPPERRPMPGPEITFEAGEDAPGGSHPRGAHPRRFAKRWRVASTTAFERPASARAAGPGNGEADGGEG